MYFFAAVTIPPCVPPTDYASAHFNSARRWLSLYTEKDQNKVYLTHASSDDLTPYYVAQFVVDVMEAISLSMMNLQIHPDRAKVGINGDTGLELFPTVCERDFKRLL